MNPSRFHEDPRPSLVDDEHFQLFTVERIGGGVRERLFAPQGSILSYAFKLRIQRGLLTEVPISTKMSRNKKPNTYWTFTFDTDSDTSTVTPEGDSKCPR
jgi:hypothetical protein